MILIWRVSFYRSDPDIKRISDWTLTQSCLDSDQLQHVSQSDCVPPGSPASTRVLSTAAGGDRDQPVQLRDGDSDGARHGADHSRGGAGVLPGGQREQVDIWRGLSYSVRDQLRLRSHHIEHHDHPAVYILHQLPRVRPGHVRLQLPAVATVARAGEGDGAPVHLRLHPDSHHPPLQPLVRLRHIPGAPPGRHVHLHAARGAGRDRGEDRGEVLETARQEDWGRPDGRGELGQNEGERELWQHHKLAQQVSGPVQRNLWQLILIPTT